MNDPPNILLDSTFPRSTHQGTLLPLHGLLSVGDIDDAVIEVEISLDCGILTMESSFDLRQALQTEVIYYFRLVCI